MLDVQTTSLRSFAHRKSIESTPLLVKKNPLLDPLKPLFMVFSLSGAVVPARGRRATLPARPPRPPAAAARDLQSPPQQEVFVACKYIFVFKSMLLPALSARILGAATAYGGRRLRVTHFLPGRAP